MSEAHPQDDFVNQLIKSQRRLYAYILTLVPNLADAEDLLQETNTVLLRKRNDFTPGTNFGAWACRVAYLEASNYFKRQGKAKCFAPGDVLLGTLADEAAGRYEKQDEKLGALSHCFDKLTAGDRELIASRYRDDQSSEQIAEATGRSSGAIRQVLFRIRTELLACIRRRLAAEESR